MARKECVIFPLLQSVNLSSSVSVENFRGQRSEDAISCLEKFNVLLEKAPEKGYADLPSFSDCCNPQMKSNLYCKQCGRVDVCRECTSRDMHVTHDNIYEETRKLGETTESVVELLEEMKRAICGVKEVKQRVRKRKDNNINLTREVFATLRKAIDEREEQTIDDIKKAAYEREKALEVYSTCVNSGKRVIYLLLNTKFIGL